MFQRAEAVSAPLFSAEAMLYEVPMLCNRYGDNPG